MKFERQLQMIADKAALHEWVDGLPDGTKGLILVEQPSEDADDEKATMWYRHFGHPTVAEAAYYAQSYMHNIVFPREE